MDRSIVQAAVNDEEKRTTAVGLFNYAESYWKSADALRQAKVKVTHPDAPVEFLYYHAIELYLKAFLRAHGHTVEGLRKKFSHHADKLSKEAEQHGLHLDDEDRVVIAYMSETDVVIQTRYIRTGYFKRPTREALERTCRSLRDSVGEVLKSLGLPIRLS